MRTTTRRRSIASALALLVIGGSLAAAQPAIAAAPGEIIVNGGFEAGLTPWQNIQGGTLTVNTADAAEGTHSVAVTNRTATGSGPWQNITGKIEEGGRYDFTAKVKYTTGPASKQFIMTLKYADKFVNVAFGQATRGEWTELSASYTVPQGQNLTDTFVFVETPWTPTPSPTNDLMDFRVDDVSITPFVDASYGALAKWPGRQNPIVSHEFGADPWAMEYDGRVYVYTTDDNQEWPAYLAGETDHNTYSRINQLNVWSSADLVNWTDHGNVKVAGPNGAATWANYSWAPAAAHKTINGVEKFFLYFCNSAGAVGVLEGDSPIGPWREPIGKALVDSSTPGASHGHNWLFDPAVIVDDDGTGYLYFGGGVLDENGQENANHPKGARVIQLGPDMVSTVGSAQVIDAPAHFESSGIHERDGKYYYSYSSNFVQGHDAGSPGYGTIAYMVADHPMGPWTADTYRGEALQNMYGFFGVGGNNHQTFFSFQGKDYLAYHAQTLNAAIANGGETGGFRSTHINEVQYTADGSIVPVQANYAGPGRVGTTDPYQVIEAETIGWQKGIEVTPIATPNRQFADLNPAINHAVTGIGTGDWIGLGGLDFGDEGTSGLTLRVAPTGGGTVQVRTGTPSTAGDENLIGQFTIPAGTGQWQDLPVTLTGLTGVQDVYFLFTGTNGDIGAIDSWEFRPATAATVQLDVTVSPRCLAGKAYLGVRATNDNAVPVTVAITSGYGAKNATPVATGKALSHTFTTKVTNLPAGQVTVTGATTDGSLASATATVQYPAHTCS